MFDFFVDWTNRVLVCYYWPLPPPEIEPFSDCFICSVISFFQILGYWSLFIGWVIWFLFGVFVRWIPTLIVFVNLCQLVARSETWFPRFMPEPDLIIYGDDNEDADDTYSNPPERFFAASPQSMPVTPTRSVLSPTSLSTPPSSASSCRSSAPSSPASSSAGSFSSASSASSEKAPTILTSAYLIKIVAMAKFIQAQGKVLDTDEKRAGAFAYGLSIIKAEETRERAYDAGRARGGIDYQESDDVRHARMKARIESHLYTYILSLRPTPQPSPFRLSFRPMQSSPKLAGFERSALPEPITSRTESAAEPFQSLAILRAAAKRPPTGVRFHRSPSQASQSQIAASRVAAASEPSSKRWADYDESDDDAFFAIPPDFGDEPIVAAVIAEQPAGPAAISEELQWSELVDLPDDDYFATPPVFGDEDKVQVVAFEEPASPAAPASLRWSDLVDLPPDDDDQYFASPPVFLIADC